MRESTRLAEEELKVMRELPDGQLRLITRPQQQRIDRCRECFGVGWALTPRVPPIVSQHSHLVVAKVVADCREVA